MSHQEVIRVHNGIKIDSDSISSAKSECAALDLNTEGLFKVFSPGDSCVKIINSVKNQVRGCTLGNTYAIAEA